MKKQLITIAFMAVACMTQAQVSVSKVMNGYKKGDTLEKNVYSEENRTYKGESWSGAFYKDKLNPNPSPVVGDALTYKGYPEGGMSIELGGFPTKDKGSRVSVYSLKEKSGKGKGTVYLSFLVNFKKLGLPGMADLVGLHHHYMGNGIARTAFSVGKAIDDANKMRFGVTFLKLKAESPKLYEYNQTHLIVMKLDYKAQTVSLFVDPQLGGQEPEADITLSGTEGSKISQGVGSIVLRNRANYQGNIGNFRLSTAWEGISSEATVQ